MHELAMISDSSNLPGYIERREGLHPALRFRFRPATLAERVEALNADLGPALAEPRGVALLLARKLLDWELPEGGTLPELLPDNILRLHPELFQRLSRIVLGYQASDPDPAWPEDIAAMHAQDDAQSLVENRAPGEIAQERREKNS